MLVVVTVFRFMSFVHFILLLIHCLVFLFILYCLFFIFVSILLFFVLMSIAWSFVLFCILSPMYPIMFVYMHKFIIHPQNLHFWCLEYVAIFWQEKLRFQLRVFVAHRGNCIFKISLWSIFLFWILNGEASSLFL